VNRFYQKSIPFSVIISSHRRSLARDTVLHDLSKASSYGYGMKPIAFCILCMFSCGALLFSAGCVQTQPVHTTVVGTPSLSPAGGGTPQRDLIAFVDSAVAYAHANGKDRALAEFSDPNGSFVKGELYIYAYDFNGTTLAHPFNPEKIGINRISEKDAKGNLFIKDLRDAAINGSGFVTFYYINPAHNRTIEQKLGYVKKVDDTWWLGSGIYSPQSSSDHSAALGTPRTPDGIRAFVENAVTYARAHGKDAAIHAFNNRTGPFVSGNLYIYALDYNGTCLALPFQPEMVGVNFSPLTDATGQKYTQTEIALVKNGGGFISYLYPNPAKNLTPEPKLSYVTRVDDTYWIGAGTYTSDITSADPDLVEFVGDARTYAQKYGREQAVAEFSRTGSPFVRGDLYIFGYDYNGTVVAWYSRPDQIGVNRFNATDPVVGKHHIREMAATARNGSGVVWYYSENPFHNNAVELKTSYVADVDGTWFIGAGKYLAPGPVTPLPTPVPTATTSMSRDDLVKYVEEAKTYALQNGRTQSLAEFNNKSGKFVSGDRYIFAYDYNGTTLALPFQPELLGTNRIGMVDAQGVRFIEIMTKTARNGSGFVDYLYPDPARNFSVEKKTSYVVDVDGTWFLGSGIYPV
jgi:polar amino acid transport system substrate-binding protein